MKFHFYSPTTSAFLSSQADPEFESTSEAPARTRSRKRKVCDYHKPLSAWSHHFHLHNGIVFLNKFGVITCSYLIYCLIPLDLNSDVRNIHFVCGSDTIYIYIYKRILISTHSAPSATRGEWTCEAVDALCCQVGLWEDEGELAESAPLDFSYNTSLRDSADFSSWEAIMEPYNVTTTYFARLTEMFECKNTRSHSTTDLWSCSPHDHKSREYTVMKS